jgi:nitronate monooxygenase
MSIALNQLALCRLLNIETPIIMAPMFLVSNEEMLLAAGKSGIAGAIPALNYRTTEQFREGLGRLKRYGQGPIGINLIVNASNIRLEEQLKVCVEVGTDFIITSLGNPKHVIEEAHKAGIRVFCDVVNAEQAVKVAGLGADAVIAVNSRAGGHAGTISAKQLIQDIKAKVDIPVISAGGVGTKKEMEEVIAYGADGFSIGSIFIASEESGVSSDYKEACVKYGAKDIVLTTRLSGTPCTVINTPYVKEIGTEQSGMERFFSENKRLKKWVKMFTFLKGMKALRKAAFENTYQSIWCAGPSIESVKAVRPVKQIVEDLLK